MKPVSLAEPSTVLEPTMVRPLRVHVSESATCILARRGLVAERLLTGVEDETLELDVYGGDYRSAWPTRDNPFLTEIHRGMLDDRGLIRPGTVVETDSVLLSVLETELPRRGRVTRPGMVWVRDNSWTAPARWRGAAVAESRLLGRPELGAEVASNIRHRAHVRLRLEHALAVGDLLVTGDHDLGKNSRDDDSMDNVLGVVGVFLDDAQMPLGTDGVPVDLIVPISAAECLTGSGAVSLVGKAAQSGRQFCQVRTMGGGYSLITQQPLGGKWGAGHVVTVAQIGWLRSRGMHAVVGELVSLKSDDVRHRVRLDALRRTGTLAPEAVPAPGMPETLNIVRSELMALGLVVDLEDAGGAVALTMRPASNEDIVAGSRGKIRRPETLNYKTLLEVEEGLFCPKVFGSDDHARRQSWGHFELAAPVVSPLWRFGSGSVLERLLGMTKERIDALFNHEIWVRERDGIWQTCELPAQPEAGQFTGAMAVEAMLKTVPPERVPTGLRGRADTLALRFVPVLPPDIRPLVLLDNGNFATSDLNDLYRRLINRNNRLEKLEELRAPWPVVWNERRELQRAADALWANRLLPREQVVLGDSDRPLADCLDLVLRRILEEDRKRIEWCARSRAVARADVAERQIMVPREAFDTLLLDAEQPVLVTAADGGGRFVALLPEAHEELVVAMSPLAYRRLGLEGRARHACMIHRPLGVEACEEARRLLEGDPGPSIAVSAGTSWFDETEADDMMAGLVESALNEKRVILDSPRGLLLAGTGCVERIPDNEAPIKLAPAMEIPIPPEQTPLTGEPLRERIGEALESYKRKACVFRLAATDDLPALGVGHVGGLPDLPPDVEWPRGCDGPLTFLAQLPLDAARTAGVLPIDVAPNSLLTIFEPPREGSARDAVFIVPASANLVRCNPPEDIHTFPWCRLEFEIVEELPCWEEFVALLKAELGPIASKDLRRFHDQEWPKQPAAVEAIKLGGWPTWRQSSESDLPLLAQIVSNDDAEMCFVDEGSLYVFSSANGFFDVVLQYF